MSQTRQPPRQGAYARAASHSSRVRLLKWLVPALATVGLAALAGVVIVSRLTTPGLEFDPSASGIVDGQFVIADPVLNGFTADDRAYRVAAQRARQTLGTTVIGLDALDAEIELEDGRTVDLIAETGVFDTDTSVLDIERAGTVTISDGTRAVFSAMRIDFDAGALETREPLTISRPGLRIEAGRLRVEDNGRRMVFENDVGVVIQPDAPGMALNAGAGEAER
ncbi:MULTISPECIES: hypothetical protein [unclassified Roseitalea]|uniref:hypothetical protein n=1 Tax=unclassified Roseitalea TaxID=2639107 RepID=UPI00273F7797|nr:MULTISPECIES: hypothetical protein [unclassified Roseitalea]